MTLDNYINYSAATGHAEENEKYAVSIIARVYV